MSMRPPSIRAQRTPLSSSKLHKLPEVYVLVPHSPYSQPFGTPEVINTHAPNSTLSPLTPLRAHNMTSAGPPSNLIKRKRSEENIDGTKKRASEMKTKKRKVSDAPPKSQAVTGAAHTVTSNATPGFPNGFFYCHQCNKKRDSSVGLFCTYKIRTPNSVARCKAKYCRPCLKNRYGQDLDEIKDRGINALHKETAGHDKAQGYIFKCPRCLSNCNCRSCRKAVGLEPTGNLTSAAKRSGANSVAVMLDGDVKMTGILPGKGKQRRVFRPPRAPDPVPTATAPKLRMPVSRKPKPLPKVTWSPVPVPQSFTLERAMPRITIREFVIRFGKLFDMSRGHLEELEEIGGRRSHEVEGNNSDSEQDVDVEVGWVGETCLRSILVGFLGLLLDSQLELGGKQSKKAIQDAIQDIKASRANLNQMWGALAGLRAELKKEDPHRPIFPDPLPPPQRTKIHTTRSGALNGSGVNVTTTAQLVPVVLPLIEMALGTQAVRDELEEGAKKVKERVREEKELAKSTREQWERAKKNNSLDKTARAEYKRSLNSLEQAQRVALQAHAPRFGPLGIDHEGRIYFALTPSVAEREAAAALLIGDTIKGGKAHGRAIVSTNERSAMRRWGWFVAVWGKKPADGVVPVGEDDDEDNDVVERWWGIWQPDEIRKLANWISIKNGIAGGKDSTNSDREDKQDTSVPGGPPIPAASSSGSKSPKASSGGRLSEVLSSHLTPLSDTSNVEDEAETDSPLSSISEGDEPGGDEGDAKEQMRVDQDDHPPPTQNELKTLVMALTEYAEVLEWRVWRMQEEPGRDSKENGVTKDKTKAIGERIRTISPANFYGPVGR